MIMNKKNRIFVLLDNFKRYKLACFLSKYIIINFIYVI